MNGHPGTQFSTIAELLFLDVPNLNFARLVSDLDTVLARFSELDRQLTWDYEDIASFDMPGTRIVLASTEAPRPGIAMSLTLSVGPSHLPPRLNASPEQEFPRLRHDALCSRLVERVRARLNPDAVMWHECEGLVSPEVLDALAYLQPGVSPRKDPQHPIFNAVDEKSIATLYAAGIRVANDMPQLPPPRNPELSRLRAALYPPEVPEASQQASPQMRLAAYSMNATLIVVALPIGAALMTYSVLRGDNMRMTSRAMVATGLATTLMNSPIGQQMAVMAGI